MLEHCKSADVILFTGRPKNFRQIREQVNKNTLVIYNGVGHNPLIITEFADIDVAVQKTVDVKLFNNGQDCAGSDAILVHEAVAPLFLEKLVASLKDFSVESKYPIEEERLCVGPLYESEDVHRAVKLIGEMTSNGLQILFGGEVNLKSNLLYPTVLIGELGKHTSYEELYAPVFPILTYKQDQELALYFQDADKRYQEKEMYVSVFGRSSFVHLLRGSIILQEKLSMKWRGGIMNMVVMVLVLPHGAIEDLQFINQF
jgi:lysyl-tRNA synthetase class 1